MLTPDSSTAGDTRRLRGLHIALNSTIKQTHSGFIVPSQAGKGKYVIALDLSQCTCDDFEMRQQPCKHIYAVQHHLEGVSELDREGVPSIPPKVTYSQRWPEYNAAQATEKGNFLRLLHGLCQGIYEPPQTVGRPRLSFADMVFACAFKVYSGLSGRRFGRGYFGIGSTFSPGCAVSTGKAFSDEVTTGEVDEGFARGGERFVVFAESTVVSEP